MRFLLILGLCLLMVPCRAEGDIPCRLVRVMQDGSMICEPTARTDAARITVRLWGIRAPKDRKLRSKMRQTILKLVDSEPIDVLPRRSVRSHELLADINVRPASNDPMKIMRPLGVLLVRRGLCWVVLPKPPRHAALNPADDALLSALELAKDDHVGVWRTRRSVHIR